MCRSPNARNAADTSSLATPSEYISLYFAVSGVQIQQPQSQHCTNHTLRTRSHTPRTCHSRDSQKQHTEGSSLQHDELKPLQKSCIFVQNFVLFFLELLHFETQQKEITKALTGVMIQHVTGEWAGTQLPFLPSGSFLNQRRSQIKGKAIKLSRIFPLRQLTSLHIHLV